MTRIFTAPACSQSDGEKGELKKDSLVVGALSDTQFTTDTVFYYSIIKTSPHQFLLAHLQAKKENKCPGLCFASLSTCSAIACTLIYD